MKRAFRSVFIESWWVLAFILICVILYEQGLKQRDSLYRQLTQKQKELDHDKIEALLKQQNLQLQVNSQADLAWIELTLMKGLGVVPEGQQKVYFYPDERCKSRHKRAPHEEQLISDAAD